MESNNVVLVDNIINKIIFFYVRIFLLYNKHKNFRNQVPIIMNAKMPTSLSLNRRSLPIGSASEKLKNNNYFQFILQKLL